MAIIIRAMNENDISAVAAIGAASFSGLRDHAIEWITCNFNAFPRMRYFVATDENEIAGYILWLEKGGFRDESVWEAEQLAVRQDARGQGMGSMLMRQSFEEIRKLVLARGAKLKLVLLTTSPEQGAQKMYEDLGFAAEAVLRDVFRGDEVIMVKRMVP